MNATLLSECCDRSGMAGGCSLISGLFAGLWPLALMNSAEEGLISLKDSTSSQPFRLTSSRSDLFCHHECFTRATLSGWFLLLSGYIAGAGKALLQLRSKLRPWARSAHAVRAILFANATIATFFGRRSSSVLIQGSSVCPGRLP